MSTPINWEKVLQLNSPANDAKTMLEILEQWLGVVWIPGLCVILSITGLVASVVFALVSEISAGLVVLIGALLSASCVAMLIFWGALNILNDARYSNNSRAYQWEQDKQHLRDLSKDQMAIQIKALKGSTVQVGDITNTQTTNTANIVNLDMTGVALMKHAEHFEEFLGQLPVRGATARAWFPKDRKPYQFSDGKEIWQGEYRALYRQALAAGATKSKGQGSKAQVMLDVSPSKSDENERDSLTHSVTKFSE